MSFCGLVAQIFLLLILFREIEDNVGGKERGRGSEDLNQPPGTAYGCHEA